MLPTPSMVAVGRKLWMNIKELQVQGAHLISFILLVIVIGWTKTEDYVFIFSLPSDLFLPGCHNSYCLSLNAHTVAGLGLGQLGFHQWA